jgi:hypothetical protein
MRTFHETSTERAFWISCFYFAPVGRSLDPDHLEDPCAGEGPRPAALPADTAPISDGCETPGWPGLAGVRPIRHKRGRQHATNPVTWPELHGLLRSRLPWLARSASSPCYMRITPASASDWLSGPDRDSNGQPAANYKSFWFFSERCRRKFRACPSNGSAERPLQTRPHDGKPLPKAPRRDDARPWAIRSVQ